MDIQFIIIACSIAAIIAGSLALIISISDTLLNNYGEVSININNGTKVLTVKGGKPLLSTLATQKIFIPSACGGRGSCGACKCQVTTDIGPHWPTETPYLTPEELKENIRLSCQIKVKQDWNINIPEELFNVQEYDATVESMKLMTHDIYEVTMDLNGKESIFKAGMYMQFEAPKYVLGKKKVKEATQRAYSLSSKPSQKGKVQMLIRLVPDGIVTTYVHNLLEEKQQIRLVGPFGDFYKQDTGSIMVCIAGGSGMAPIKSIVEDMDESGELADREVWYFFGAQTQKDLYYVDEFNKLAEKWSNLHFIPALSNEPADSDWTGERGLITDVVDKYMKEKIDSTKLREGYLCGSPGMIDACNVVLTKNNVKIEDIFYDKF